MHGSPDRNGSLGSSVALCLSKLRGSVAWAVVPMLSLCGAAVLVLGEDHLAASQSDLVDSVLVYDSRNRHNSDVNFRKISEYYGLRWDQVDISATSLDPSQFRDEQGNTVQAAGIDASDLNGLSEADLGVLRAAVVDGGLRLLVSGISQSSPPISYLTNGEVTGARAPTKRGYSYFINSTHPEVSRQFTGQTVGTGTSGNDYGLTISTSASRTDVIISGGDSISSTYPILAMYHEGQGAILLQSTRIGRNLDQNTLWLLYDGYRNVGQTSEQFQDFSGIVPMMMFVRYAGGDEAWHTDRQFANLTIDDPPLTQPFWNLSYTNRFYTDLLSNMQAHNFHTTIAFVPVNYSTTDPGVAQTLIDNPEYYSLAVHGDNHNCPDFPASAGPAQLLQEANEALSRMSQHRLRTGIPYPQDMVFPCGNFQVESLAAIKTAGFVGTVNGNTVPEGQTLPQYWDYHMYQADLDWSNFASIQRVGVPYSVPLHELFIGRPVFAYTHPDFFSGGMNAFNVWADQFNQIYGGLEWRSMDYIVKHLYLEKTNDDQTISVMFYTRDVIVHNGYTGERTFRFTKNEPADTSVIAVRVNGIDTSFTVQGGVLQADAQIPGGADAEVTLVYLGEDSSTPTPGPTATRTPRATSTPTPPASPTPTKTASPTPTRTAPPAPTQTASPTPTITASPTPWPTATPSPTPTLSPTATPVPGPTITPTPDPTATSTATLTPTPGPGYYGTPTATSAPTEIPKPANTSTPAGLPAPTVTPTPTFAPGPTATPIPFPKGPYGFTLYVPAISNGPAGW